MMWEVAVVVVIVGTAIFFAGRSLWRCMSGKTGHGCQGCKGCGGSHDTKGV